MTDIDYPWTIFRGEDGLFYADLDGETSGPWDSAWLAHRSMLAVFDVTVSIRGIA